METANQTVEQQTTGNKNVEGLLKALDYNGFGPLKDKFMENVNRQRDEFKLYATDKNPDGRGQQLSYELSFRANDEGKYYWNTTKATLSSPDPLTNGRSHSFFAGMYAASQQQMKPLLNGTSLFRNKLATAEGKPYSAWQKIHFNEEKDKYGNHPLRNYYENNGPRVDAALAKWNDSLSMTNSQRAVAVEQFKKGEPAVLTINVKDNNAIKQEKAVVFFDAQYKDLMIVRSSGEVLERERNRGENIVAANAPSPQPSQGSAIVSTPAPTNGSTVETAQQGRPITEGDNKQTSNTPSIDHRQGQPSQSPLPSTDSQTTKGASSNDQARSNKIEAPTETAEDRKEKSEKRGMKHGR